MNPAVTVIIPSKNCLYDLKRTIENLSLQIKSSQFEVVIIEDESEDGSLQYADQSRSEYYKRLKIHLVEKKEEVAFIENLKSPYVFLLSPGFLLKERDAIFKTINEFSQNIDLILYPKEGTKFYKYFFPKYYIENKKISFDGIFCKREHLEKIESSQEDSKKFSFLLKNLSQVKKIKVRKKAKK